MKQLKFAAAAGLSAVLFFLGTGLHPFPWFTWLAPLPVLLLAPRVRFRTALAAGFLAWAVGQAAMWPYFLTVVRMPLPMIVASQLGMAVVFGLLVAGSGALVRRRRPLSAAVLVPAGWAVTEYAISVTMPHGAWWSLAYTQADVLPVLQTASVTGVWGVTFLLLAVPSAIAVLLSGTARPLRVAVVYGALVVVALGYGTWHLRDPGKTTDRVGLLVTDHPDDTIPVDTPAGRDLVARYAAQAEAMAATGVRTIVLPEKTFLADERTLRTLSTALTRITTRHHVNVITGLVMKRAGAGYNMALDYPAGGGRPAEYTKRFLIPGLEEELSPGHQVQVLPGGAGLIICKDLDFPGLVRDYRAKGATVLYAPAWDFNGDGWLHSRMAIVRGVENGLTVARAARAGHLVISDPGGRTLADVPSASRGFTAVTAALPAPAGPTLYARLGDWFPWLCGALMALALIRRGGGEPPPPEDRLPGQSPAEVRRSAMGAASP